MVWDQFIEFVVWVLFKDIQDCLFIIGANLVFDLDKDMFVFDIQVIDIEVLEKVMDEMDEVFFELKNFILLGGYFVVLSVYIVCCVCCWIE